MGAMLVTDAIGMVVDRPVYSYKVSGLLLLSKGSVLTREIAIKLKEHGVYAVFVNAEKPILTTPESLLSSINTTCLSVVSNKATIKYCDWLIQEKELIELLNKLGNHDYETLKHSLSVGLLFYSFYIDNVQLRNKMGITGCLHDIGKLNIPKEILSKPRKLTAEEYEIVKLHPSAGYTMLMRMGYDIDLNTVLHHHEKVNGTGYPYGHTGALLETNTKILQVFDVFEALTAFRTYRTSISKTKALSIIESEIGKTFDYEVSTYVLKFLKEGETSKCIIEQEKIS